MNPDPTGPDVGSVADEAARLFSALSARLGEQGGAAAGETEPAAHTGDSCRWCPLCQAIGFLRDTSPEVRAQVVASAGALMLALRQLLDEAARAPGKAATGRTDRRTDNGVEHINLADAPEGDEPWG